MAVPSMCLTFFTCQPSKFLLLYRVVNVSSISEQLGLFALYTPRIPYDDIPGYNLGDDSGEKPYVMAKTHILMATCRELAKRLEGTGVDVIAGVTTAADRR